MKASLLMLCCVCVLLISCEKQDSTLIDSAGASPFILSASITPAVIDTDTINVGTERKPEDVLLLSIKTHATITHPNDLEDITATARIFGESGGSSLSSSILLDDGNNADSTKGDGVFSGWNTFEIKRSDIGFFRVEIVSEDARGFKSSTHILPLQIVRNNQPPVISNLQAPDTIRLNSPGTSFLISVQASDPDGLADIRQVIFNSFLPTGQPSTNNPFRLYDDGTNGDQLAGNGTYSLQIGRPTNTGPYRFEFQAFDRSNEVSNIIIHTITVIP